MKVSGNDLVGQALAQHGVDSIFFIMGGPMNDVVKAATARGVRPVDVRHEQAAAMMAHAYARVRARPGVCSAASGPGTLNLTMGLANALVDCAPVVALGGASPLGMFGRGAFQEFDQLASMRPVTKWADRVHETKRIPEYVHKAFQQAISGKPGPVYLDLPGDVLYQQVEEETVVWPRISAPNEISRPAASAEAIGRIIEKLRAAKRPVVVSGSGIIWSSASAALGAFIDATGIPFYTTPQGRGVVAEDHPCSFVNARSKAFREADLVLVIGTRLNYVIAYGNAPRFAADATFIRVDIDPAEIACADRVDLGVVGDARVVLEQLCSAVAGNVSSDSYASWRRDLAADDAGRREKQERQLQTDQMPIHPLRLCKEVRDILDRDTILAVDGQEILNYGRQTIPSFLPGHRLNSGPFGTMGVGLPFGVGAKVAHPDKRVVVLHGDGSFGLNAMELDTAVRHKLPMLVVISLNGGWTADPERIKPGRDLGYTRFDLMAQALGCHGEFVERPEDIRPALERGMRAVEAGQVAVVNVVTDWRARSTTGNFTAYST